MSNGRRRRPKRATAEDIYRACKPFGTCPDDVVNKIENKTVADKILQYGGSAVFFGGLGIGTGKGTGGSTGYVPLGEGPGVRIGGPGIRPSIPVDPVVPTDIIPIDTLGPTEPSIVPLSEGGSGVDFTNVDVFAEVHPPSTGDTATIPPTVTDGEGAPILEVSPDPTPPTRGTRIHRTHYHNPAFQVTVHSTVNAGETSAADEILVTTGAADTIIGAGVGASGGNQEDIPLLLFGGDRFEDIDIAETSFGGGQPRTSTPESTPIRPLRPGVRRPGLLSRFFQQVRVPETTFLRRPQDLIAYDNPAFDDTDITLRFEQDVEDVARAAPRVEFQDIVELGRPIFSETREGNVRVSRLGRRGTIRTRAGTVIGGRVHFFHDVSSIETDDIPLLTYSEQTGGGVLVDEALETPIDVGTGLQEIYPEDALMDVYESVGDNSQLVIGERSRNRVVTVPNFENVIKTAGGVVIDWARGRFTPTTPAEGVTPGPPFPDIIIVDVGSSLDFIFHPGLLPRKKKRKLYHV